MMTKNKYQLGDAVYFRNKTGKLYAGKIWGIQELGNGYEYRLYVDGAKSIIADESSLVLYPKFENLDEECRFHRNLEAELYETAWKEARSRERIKFASMDVEEATREFSELLDNGFFDDAPIGITKEILGTDAVVKGAEHRSKELAEKTYANKERVAVINIYRNEDGYYARFITHDIGGNDGKWTNTEYFKDDTMSKILEIFNETADRVSFEKLQDSKFRPYA